MRRRMLWHVAKDVSIWSLLYTSSEFAIISAKGQRYEIMLDKIRSWANPPPVSVHSPGGGEGKKVQVYDRATWISNQSTSLKYHCEEDPLPFNSTGVNVLVGTTSWGLEGAGKTHGLCLCELSFDNAIPPNLDHQGACVGKVHNLYLAKDKVSSPPRLLKSWPASHKTNR